MPGITSNFSFPVEIELDYIAASATVRLHCLDPYYPLYRRADITAASRAAYLPSLIQNK